MVLYLQRFRNFLNLHLELDLEFILKVFLAINISDFSIVTVLF